MPASNVKHEPTDKTRAEVSALSSFGNTQVEIGLYLGINVDTLTKYYRFELDTAVIKANAMVARSLFNKAVNQDDLSAQIFWLKTRGKWRNADAEAATHQTDAVKAEIESLRADLSLKNRKEY